MSNHVNKVPQQSSQQVNCTSSRQIHHQKDAYWNPIRSNNLPENVSQSHHVSECNIEEQDGPTIINSCKLIIYQFYMFWANHITYSKSLHV